MLWPHTCSLMTWCMKELTFYSFRWIQHLGVNGSIVQQMILTQLEALAVWMMCDAASYPVLPWQTSVGCQMTAALPDLERKGRNVSSINRLSPRSLLEWGRLSRLCITRLTLTVTISRPAVIHFVLHFIHSDDTGYACCAIDYPPVLVWLTHVFIGLECHVVLGLNLCVSVLTLYHASGTASIRKSGPFYTKRRTVNSETDPKATGRVCCSKDAYR